MTQEELIKRLDEIAIDTRTRHLIICLIEDILVERNNELQDIGFALDRVDITREELQERLCKLIAKNAIITNE